MEHPPFVYIEFLVKRVELDSLESFSLVILTFSAQSESAGWIESRGMMRFEADFTRPLQNRFELARLGSDGADHALVYVGPVHWGDERRETAVKNGLCVCSVFEALHRPIGQGIRKGMGMKSIIPVMCEKYYNLSGPLIYFFWVESIISQWVNSTSLIVFEFLDAFHSDIHGNFGIRHPKLHEGYYFRNGAASFLLHIGLPCPRADEIFIGI